MGSFGILILMFGRSATGRNLESKVRRAAREACNATWNSCTNIAFDL
jgi:hypothetical protein